MREKLHLIAHFVNNIPDLYKCDCNRKKTKYKSLQNKEECRRVV